MKVRTVRGAGLAVTEQRGLTHRGSVRHRPVKIAAHDLPHDPTTPAASAKTDRPTAADRPCISATVHVYGQTGSVPVSHPNTEDADGDTEEEGDGSGAGSDDEDESEGVAGPVASDEVGDAEGVTSSADACGEFAHSPSVTAATATISSSQTRRTPVRFLVRPARSCRCGLVANSHTTSRSTRPVQACPAPLSPPSCQH